MGNSPGFPEAPSPHPGGRRFSDKATAKNASFDVRWQLFVDSLDVTDEKLKLIEQLPYTKKLELVLNFEQNTAKCSPAQCVESIRMLRISQIAANKRKQTHDEFQNKFSSAEISLRTNKIDWVLEFLENSGLEAIVNFMGESLKYLSRTDAFKSSNLNVDTNRRKGSMSFEDFVQASLARRDTPSPSKPVNIRGSNEKPPPTPNFSLNRNKSSSPTLKCQNIPLSASLTLETLKNCIHLCLKCFKTLMNNQDGCNKAFQNSEVIEIITFCVLHPNYATKALALDLLSAICLVGGGHPRVLKAFDNFRRTIGESASFETIMNDFRVHENLPLEQYNFEYSVASIQFINIVVHSPENINLRVYLQYAFTLLGLDDFLQALQSRPGEKLNRHVDAYINNMVNCSLLLNDAEAKEAAVEEVSRLEAALEASETTAQQQAAAFKQRDLALSELVESLRGKIRDINVATGLQESANKRIQELEQSLAVANRQIQHLQNDAIHSANGDTATNSLGQVRPAPNPRQKKPSVSCMTTSTTLPMGFELQDGDNLQHAESRADSRRKSMSLDMLITTNFSTTVSSASSVTQSSLSSSTPMRSDINSGTFSRKSGSVAEKSRHGIISSTLISQVPDLGLAIKTFASVSTKLLQLRSRLVTTSSPSPPSPSPAVALPDWRTPTTLEVSRVLRQQQRRRILAIDNTQCHQMAVILPDPWATCFVHADNAFKMSTEADEDEKEGHMGGGDSGATWIVQWLLKKRLVTINALKMIDTDYTEGPRADDLPLIAELLGAKLNPFSAMRLLSLVEVIGDEECDWNDSVLPVIFDRVEDGLRDMARDRKVSSGPINCGRPYWHWPLLLGYLRVNLLPFVLAKNLQLLIEQLAMLSACCNSIIGSSKLATVLRIAETLVGTFLGKPDLMTVEVSNLSSLTDWCLLVRRKSGEADVTGSVDGRTDSPCVPRQGSSEGPPSCDSVANHRRKPFMQALYKAVELVAPDALDWTQEVAHLDPASRILPSDIRDRIREVEYDLSLRDTLFPPPNTPGNLQYVCPDASAKLAELESLLTDVETLIGAAAFQLYSATGSRPVAVSGENTETFSDREFCLELGSLARFYAAFKKLTSDAEKRARNHTKASSCKGANTSAIGQHRNGHPSRIHHHHQRVVESAGRSSKNGHDKHDGGERKRQTSRHLNTVGIMDNILAGLDSEPLYADIHKVPSKVHENAALTQAPEKRANAPVDCQHSREGGQPLHMQS